MKKIIVFASFLMLFLFPTSVFGQTIQATRRAVCLNVVGCRKSDECKAIGFSGSKAHIGYLTLPEGTKVVAQSDTYIVECVATDDPTVGQICTTGNSATDLILYEQDNVAALKEYGYGFDFMKATDKTDLPNPLTSKSDGTLDPFAWKSHTSDSLMRQFLAVNIIPVTPTTEPGPASEAGGVGALQQGTFAFDIIDALGAGSLESCVSVSWDPYGRVFDAQTLEPVMGSTVTLSLKRSDGTYSAVTTNDLLDGNIINPQTIKEDGLFNFVVPDGTYKLNVSRLGYTFPVADIGEIHSNYTKIYSDVYPTLTGEEIVQSGSIQHRDVPIKTAGVSLVTEPKLMEVIRDTNLIQGRVSHPFAVVTAYSVKPSPTDPTVAVRYRQLKQVQSDKNGSFKIEIDSTGFEEAESFGELEITKTDLKTLTQNTLYQKIISFFAGFIKVEAADTTKSTTTVSFNPIPVYLEGYAYDSSGGILPNATVSIYLNYSKVPYYQTKTDEKGYFKISSEYLPKVTYQIKYTSAAGSTITTTTTQFINQNQEYLEEKGINLNTYKNKSGKELSKKDLKATVNPTGFFKGTSGETTSTEKETSPTSTNSMLIIIGVLIFLIVVTAVVIGVYMMKKRQQQPPVPPTL